MDQASRWPLASVVVIVLMAGVIIAGGGYGTYRYRALGTQLAAAEEQAAAATSQLDGVQAELSAARDENTDLAEDLRTEEKKNDSFEKQLKKLSGTVNVLDRLSKTDPELLKKYSKVSFLNENYIPARLTEIPKEYVSTAATALSFHAQALPYLESLLDAAHDDDLDLSVASAYRSFGTQAALKSSYKVTYGSGANAFSADQGYSEHQLGTAVDFIDPNGGGGLDGFEKTEAYAWLTKNAYRYGFVLSYPAGNAYYQFEPWHWRFVGTDLARDLHRDDEHFYDMDQRTIDEYLVSIFD